MIGNARRIVVISDLHIGGRYPQGDDPSDRGFRICTHVDVLAAFVRELTASRSPVELVINGDFVDFLAEEWPGDTPWRSFIEDPDVAAQTFDTIAGRDPDCSFFLALGELLTAGHALTVLLGNHDVELSFPSVRRHLREAMRVGEDSRFRFLYDGEAYTLANAIIEHGNRYDGFNVIDHGGLRRMRSAQTRRETLAEGHAFRRPPGSELVSGIMNHIKSRHPFIDLIKPETGAAIPLLLALEPGVRGRALRIAELKAKAALHDPDSEQSQPRFGDDIASDTGGPLDGGFAGFASGDDDSAPDALKQLLLEHLGTRGAENLLATVDAARSASGAEDIDTSGDIAFRDHLGWARLLLSSDSDPLESRIDGLLGALRALQGDKTFSRDVETDTSYLRAAQQLSARGFEYVVFGHTHLAKCVALENGMYFNSGTWADLMRFPQSIISRPDEEARPALLAFCRDLENRRFERYIEFIPTYVELEVDANERVVNGHLSTFES